MGWRCLCTLFLRQKYYLVLCAGFAIKRSKVKGPAQEIQFLGIKWQDGRRHIPTDVIDKISGHSESSLIWTIIAATSSAVRGKGGIRG